MAVTVDAKLSTDTGNSLSFGTDNGIYGPLVSPRGGSQWWTLDNSFVGPSATTYWYLLGPTTSAQSWISGTAWISPFVVSRSCKIASLYHYVSTAGAGSQIYHASFASDPTTGLPTNKIVDVGYCAGTGVGAIAHTMLDTATVYTANTLYWMCSWAYTTSGTPSGYFRNIGQQATVRLPVAPTGVTWFSSGGMLSYQDTTSGWTTKQAAPTSLSLNAPSASGGPGSAIYAPSLAWGLQNV